MILYRKPIRPASDEEEMPFKSLQSPLRLVQLSWLRLVDGLLLIALRGALCALIGDELLQVDGLPAYCTEQLTAIAASYSTQATLILKHLL